MQRNNKNAVLSRSGLVFLKEKTKPAQIAKRGKRTISDQNERKAKFDQCSFTKNIGPISAHPGTLLQDHIRKT